MIQDIIAKLRELGKVGEAARIEKSLGGQESDIFVLSSDTEDKPLRLYVKVVKEDNFRAGTLIARLHAEYSCLEQTYEYFRYSPLHGAVRPVSFFPQWRAIVTAESPGILLKPLVMSYTRLLSMRDIKPLKRVFFLCGKWLRDFHHHVRAETSFETEEISLYVSRRLAKLEGDGLIEPDLAAALRNTLERIQKRGLETHPRVLLHNDFIPGNILVDGEKICVLDFGWVGRGIAYFDIVSFWLELQKLGEAPQYARDKIAVFQKAFLEGYGEISDRSVEFKCFELLHRVNSLTELCRGRQKMAWPSRIMAEYEIRSHRRWLAEFRREPL
jgi:tRNA A-37 threonylcarbamoyl transferase component Bud32